MRRRTARRQAFFLLYESDVNDRSMDEAFSRWRSYRGDLSPYAIRIARGVENEREELDRILSEVSVGWPVHRMSVVDRAILRLALFEMLHVEDAPPEVAITEAIELAKGFSSDEAPVFVRGVLRGAETMLSEKVEHG